MLSDSKQVGKKIREYRLKLDLTQQELAEMIGKTWEMVSRYERGQSSAHREIDAIAEALEVTTAELVDSENDVAASMFPRVPYFTKRARTYRSYREYKTNLMYYCPDWILRKDKDAFAIPADAVDVGAADLTRLDGVYFISPNTPCSMGDLALYFTADRNPRIFRLNFVPKDEELTRVMGRVLAFERHFPD